MQHPSQNNRPDRTLIEGSQEQPLDEANQLARTLMESRELSETLEDVEAHKNADEDSRAPDKFIGKIIDGRYDILELAGRGGMSAVYKARHVLTQKTIALKLMSPHLLQDENAMRRFQQEAKAASRLHHANAISVLDMGVTEDGQPFLTMDYLEGRSLSEEIYRQGQIDAVRCIHIFLQTASALAHAHDQRIVHRDLKPSNVMLITQDGDSDFVKVVDFGIAKILMDGGDSLKLTTTGDVFGSPYYMSPEQCLGHKLDARSDIYSMGCLMYEALTGKVPHQGKNVLETMYMHTNLAAPALTEIDADPRLSFRLDQIIQKCMAKLADQRYQSMLELKDDLMLLSTAPQKGSKFAAKLGMKASDEGRRLDNKLASISSKKIFWIAVPLVLVLGTIVASYAYYWASTVNDPSPADRELMLNKNLLHGESIEKPVTAGSATMTMSTPADTTGAVVSGSEDNVHMNGDFYSAMSHAKHDFSPEEFYNDMRRYGFYFRKVGDYGQALEAFEKALATSAANHFNNDFEEASMRTAMVECLMAAGDGSKLDSRLLGSGKSELEAWNLALKAYQGFKSADVSTKPDVSINLGNLLELSAGNPERLKAGAGFYQELIKVRNSPPSVKAVTYYQAAKFAQSCADHGIDFIPVYSLDAASQQTTQKQLKPGDILDQSLQTSLSALEQLERKRKLKRIVQYDEGVVYNWKGLLAEKSGKLDEAAMFYDEALRRFVENNESEAAAKLLFNLSDIRLKQRDLVAYYELHRDAKRIWDGLLHPIDLTKVKTH